MIKIGNYWLSYAGRNYITIGLPPTVETARDTVTPIEDRRTFVTDEELAQVLGLVMAIFKLKKPGNGKAETDYISRRETENAFPGLFSTIYTALEINKIIRSIPAADVRPVVHGKLIHETIDTNRSITGKFHSPTAICSICGSRVITDVNFCPFCGVDVREEVPGHE